jgi:uncharacterized protein (TIGR02147 family)
MVDKSLEGKYFKRDAHLDLPSGRSHSFIFAFHKMMMEKSVQALLGLKPSQREVSATTMTFDASKLDEARAFLDKMRIEFTSRFGNAKEGDAVYQLNYQLFEMARIKKDA